MSHASPVWDLRRHFDCLGAYLYDSHNALAAANAPASVQLPLVNWDVVSVKWEAAHSACPRRMGRGRQLSPAVRTRFTTFAPG